MKTAVLVIDVQHGIFGAQRKPAEAERVITNIIQLIQHEKSRGHPVIFIQHEAPGMVEYGSVQWQLFADLPVAANDHKIRKQTPDAFLNTDLQAVLQQLDVQRLIICGYASDFCIDRTVFKAACSGYQVCLVEDGHTTHDKPHLGAKQITAHHNFILSQHPAVTLVRTEALVNN